MALLRNSTLLGHLCVPADQPYSCTLLPRVQSLMWNLGLSLGDVDLFAVGAGPGSFTGLRVGLTAVKAWAEVFGKPIAAVSGLAAIAFQASGVMNEDPNAFLAAVLDARRGQVYGAIYGRSGQASDILVAIGPEVLMSADEFLELVEQQIPGKAPIFVSSTPEVIHPALERSRYAACQVEQVSSVLAPSVGCLGYAQALRGDVLDALRLDANYLRRSDAEHYWDDK